MISEPGLWEFSAEDYHADPCPEPSLNNSLIKPLLLAPAKAWWAHPRLNPIWKPKESSRLDLGSVAHKLLLGRGREIKVLDFADWRTNASKEAREEARAAGQIPILGHDFDTATAMERAARARLDGADMRETFSPTFGKSEISLIWRDTAGCWGRNMIDWMHVTGPVWEVWDYKTTDRSARPEDAGLGSLVVDLGYDTQAALQDRGLVALYPELAGRINHRLMFQETEPPYLISVVEPDAATMAMAAKKVDYAFKLFADCLKSNVWPGYTPGVVPLRHADYLANRWLEREMAEAEVIERVGRPDLLRHDGQPDRRSLNKGGRPRGSKNKTRAERVRLAKERQDKAQERLEAKQAEEKTDEPTREHDC